MVKQNYLLFTCWIFLYMKTIFKLFICHSENKCTYISSMNGPHLHLRAYHPPCYYQYGGSQLPGAGFLSFSLSKIWHTMYCLPVPPPTQPDTNYRAPWDLSRDSSRHALELPPLSPGGSRPWTLTHTETLPGSGCSTTWDVPGRLSRKHHQRGLLHSSHATPPPEEPFSPPPKQNLLAGLHGVWLQNRIWVLLPILFYFLYFLIHCHTQCLHFLPLATL